MKYRGFTLIELLVVIAIIAILAAILFPVFISTKERARQSQCQSNLKQLGAGMQTYTQDWGDRYPILTWQGRDRYYFWIDTLWTGGYLKNKWVFLCPSSTNGPFRKLNYPDWLWYCSYGYNGCFLGCGYETPGGLHDHGYSKPAVISEIGRPSKTLLLCDTQYIKSNGQPDATRGYYYAPAIPLHPEMQNFIPEDRHQKIVEVVMVDGHVSGVKRTDLLTNIDYWKRK